MRYVYRGNVMNDTKRQQVATSGAPGAGKEPLRARVLSRIEHESLAPTSRWIFFCYRSLTRLLFALSVGIGALAVAVSATSVLHVRYALYEATHQNLYTFLVDALPYLWLFVLALTLMAAVYNFRHTAQGYRYSLSTLVISSAGLSIVGGAGLYAFGIGQLVDQKLDGMMPFYRSLEGRQVMLWQRPAEGRLVGVVAGQGGTSTLVTFEDLSGERWKAEVDDLSEADLELLHSARKVRLLGIVLSTTTPHIYACGVFPWVYDHAVTMGEMADSRAAFLERMHRYHEPAEVIVGPNKATAMVLSDSPNGMCANLAAVRRISDYRAR